MQNDETSDDHNSSRKRIEVFSNRKFSEAFHSIAELCTQRDPANRPSVGQLLNHPFFKQCRKSDETLSDILKPVPLIQDRYKSWDGKFRVKLIFVTKNFQLRNFNFDFV